MFFTALRRGGGNGASALTHTHAPCVLVMYCNMCKARAPPTTCCPPPRGLFWSRENVCHCGEILPSASPKKTKKKNKSVCFWEDFPGLTSPFKAEGSQPRGESARELSPAGSRDHNQAVFYGRGRPSAATVGAGGVKGATAVGISWVLDPWCFAYRCRREAAAISALHVCFQRIPV